METKINIAEILKDKPQGTKLYSRICGAVELKKVINVRKKKSIVVKELNSNNQHRFWHDGNFFRAGQCVLQPSENMADWSKFSWKKGDVLQNNDHNTQVIFDRFISDTYEMVRCKYWLKVYNGIERFVVETNVFTKDYFKVSEELSQCYINEIENRCGGTLNLETLEIEKTNPKFNDGDVLFVKCNDSAFIEIFKYSKNNGDLYDRASLDTTNQILDISGKYRIGKDEITELRLATEAEKQQLFSALEKEGKAWDSEKKQIVDLKQKWTPNPFDRVITRNDDDDIWTANIFSHMDSHGEYVTIGCVGGYTYCIPYNEETAKLIGTTNNVEG